MSNLEAMEVDPCIKHNTSDVSSRRKCIVYANSDQNKEDMDIIMNNFPEFMELCSKHDFGCSIRADIGKVTFKIHASKEPARKLFVELDALILKKKMENSGIDMKFEEMEKRMIDMESIWEKQFSEEMEALKISSGQQSAKSVVFINSSKNLNGFYDVSANLKEFIDLCDEHKCKCSAQMEDTSITIRLIPLTEEIGPDVIETLTKFIEKKRTHRIPHIPSKSFMSLSYLYKRPEMLNTLSKQGITTLLWGILEKEVASKDFFKASPFRFKGDSKQVKTLDEFLQEKYLQITKYNVAIYNKFFISTGKSYIFEKAYDKGCVIREYLSFLQTNTQFPNKLQLEICEKLSKTYKDGLEKLKKSRNEPMNFSHLKTPEVNSTCHFIAFVNDATEMHMCVSIVDKKIITWHVGKTKEEALDQFQTDYQLVLKVSPLLSVGDKEYDEAYTENKKVIEWMKNNFLCINVPSHGLFVNSIPAIYNICHAHYTSIVKK